MSERLASPLPVREAYRRWAPSYEVENPVTVLDQLAVERLSPSPAGCRLLDAGCGTGRRSRHLGDAWVAGADLVLEMLQVGRRAQPAARLVAADLRALPFAAASFEVVWCRLALGHLPRLGPAYRELARVTRPGGVLVVTDFHPRAHQAGHRRTFRDACGTVHLLEYWPHQPAAHRRAARRAGFAPGELLELPVGPPVEPFYRAQGRLDWYQRDLGLPLVFGWRFVKARRCPFGGARTRSV